MRRWTMFAALFGGCYQPAAESTCTVMCPTGACPTGMTCGTDGWCRRSPSDTCDGLDGGNRGDGSDGSASLCYGTGFARICLAAEPTMPLTYSTATLDTNDASCATTKLQSDGTKLCYFIGTTITISGALRVTGPNAAVFLGTQAVVVASTGAIDVGSHILQPGILGAGAGSAPGCATSGLLDGSSDVALTGGGGGAGGSFIARGGDGGLGQAAMSVTTGGGTAGQALATPMSVRGGCAGGSGGPGMAGSAGRAGPGGGAVYLMSGSVVRVNGIVNASGAGGGKPTATGGAGGGGSGGFIGLDAPIYELTGAQIFAVGGSGGAGASPNGPGAPGNEATGPQSPGQTTTAGTGGSGGAGGPTAGGGNGGSASLGGGGGGGGSCGFIGMTNLGQIPPSVFAPLPTAM